MESGKKGKNVMMATTRMAMAVQKHARRKPIGYVITMVSVDNVVTAPKKAWRFVTTVT